SGSIIADMRPAQPVFNVNIKTQKVDSNRLLSAVSNLKDTLYGLLNSGAQLSFAAVPAGSDIASTLNGRLSLNLTNGKLTKVDILQQISQVGKFQSLGRPAANFTNIQQLSGDFNIQNGVATTHNLKAVIDGGSLAANGSVNLPAQSLDMRVTAVLSRAQSQAAGGTQIGGFMQTVLANQNGELVVPLIVTGTFQNMHFSPDVQQMAQMKAKNLLPSFSNPGQFSSGILGALGGKGGGQGGIGGILGGLTGGQQQQQQQPNAASQPAQKQKQQNGLGGALGGLLGGKKSRREGFSIFDC
ncbi:MAG: AsmA-like C-terminal region-containing protein, partial [Candidatus Korobacteraceae bacterium]